MNLLHRIWSLQSYESTASIKFKHDLSSWLFVSYQHVISEVDTANVW